LTTGLLQSEHLTNAAKWKVTETYFRQNPHVFSASFFQRQGTSAHAVKAKVLLLSNDKYTFRGLLMANIKFKVKGKADHKGLDVQPNERKDPRNPLHRRVSGRFGVQKKLLPLFGFEPQIGQRVALSLTATALKMMIIITGTTAHSEPRLPFEASASCPCSLQHSSNFSPPASWLIPSHYPPILVLVYPFAFFLLLLQRGLFLQGSVPPVE
jgi:hypothetical protein